MFDIGFWEVLILATLGLLILGPERLPRVVSKIGRWVGAARRTANQLRWQIERELELTERQDRANKKSAKPKNVIYPVHSSRGDGASEGEGANAGADGGTDASADTADSAGSGTTGQGAEADPGPRLGNAMGATHDSSGVAQDPPPAAGGGAAGKRDGTASGTGSAQRSTGSSRPAGSAEAAPAGEAGQHDPDTRQN